MPANGDNKPKLQKMIEKLSLAPAKGSREHLYSAAIALILWLTNGFILWLCLTSNSASDSNTMMTACFAIGFLSATAYLWYRLENVPDNH